MFLIMNFSQWIATRFFQRFSAHNSLPAPSARSTYVRTSQARKAWRLRLAGLALPAALLLLSACGSGSGGGNDQADGLPATIPSNMHRVSITGGAGSSTTVRFSIGGITYFASTFSDSNFSYRRDVRCSSSPTTAYVFSGFSNTVTSTFLADDSAGFTPRCGGSSRFTVGGSFVTRTITYTDTSPPSPTTWTVVITNTTSTTQSVALTPPDIRSGGGYTTPTTELGTVTYNADTQQTTFSADARWRGKLPCTTDFSASVTGYTTIAHTGQDSCGQTVQVSIPGSSSGNPGLGGSPDLVVQSPTVNDSTLTAGQSFTLSATVRNQGTGSAGFTTLRYYRSTNATISSSDTEVGTDSVSSLSASGTSPESISLTAPTSAGTYYYGACVDTVSSESNTSNNCSTGVRVTVSAPAVSSDLVVGTPTVNDSTLTAGQSFTLSATVRNQGTGSARSTTLRWYRSRNSTIDSNDTPAGTDFVSALSAGRTGAESISLTAPTSAGTYYYGACVDTVSGESDTSNNCSTGVRVTVSAPAVSPDLVVGTPTVNDSTLTAGQRFTLSATVRNQGTGSARSTTLRYYRSTNSIISSGDTEVGTDSVSSLSASGTSPESISLTAPTSAGTYYYGACVVAVSGESDTGNNCSTGVRVTVSAPTVTQAASLGPLTTCTGRQGSGGFSTFTVGGSLTANVALSQVRLTATIDGRFLGSTTLLNLSPGERRTYSITGTLAFSGTTFLCEIEAIPTRR